MEQLSVLPVWGKKYFDNKGHLIDDKNWTLRPNPTYADVLNVRVPSLSVCCLPNIRDQETVVEKTEEKNRNTYKKYHPNYCYLTYDEEYTPKLKGKGKLKNNHKKKRRQSSFRGERKHPESSIEYNTLHGYNGEFDYSHCFYMVRPHLVPCNYCNQYNGTCMGCSYYEEHYVEATIQYLKLHGSFSS